MTEDIYKLKYLKYKKKYLDLQSKVGAGVGAIAASRRIQQESARRQREHREQREAEARARIREEEARFNALPEEEKQRILQERKEAEERRIAELEERIRIRKQNDLIRAEPLIKQINDLHSNTLNSQCGFSGCRNISSNIKTIKKLLNQIKEISYEIANSVAIKLNESTDKQKKCNCVTFF